MPPSQDIVIILEFAVLLAAVLLVITLLVMYRASNHSATDLIANFLKKAVFPISVMVAAIALVIGADFLLPVERISTKVDFERAVNGNKREVFYSICCSGGEIASCETSGTMQFAVKQSVVIQRSRILDRCSIKSSDSSPDPCKCN